MKRGKGPNSRGMSRHHLTNAVHNSLQRLQVDYIDLYQIHGVDPATPIEEALHALERLVQAGLIRYIGVSNWSAWQVAKALGIAERRGHVSINCLQAYYTIAARELERELAPMALSEQLALMVWAPLAGGLLSGKYRSECEPGKKRKAKGCRFSPCRCRADRIVHRRHENNSCRTRSYNCAGCVSMATSSACGY